MSRSVKRFFRWKIKLLPSGCEGLEGIQLCAVIIGRPVVEIVCGRCFVEFVNFG